MLVRMPSSFRCITATRSCLRPAPTVTPTSSARTFPAAAPSSCRTRIESRSRLGRVGLGPRCLRMDRAGTNCLQDRQRQPYGALLPSGCFQDRQTAHSLHWSLRHDGGSGGRADDSNRESNIDPSYSIGRASVHDDVSDRRRYSRGDEGFCHTGLYDWLFRPHARHQGP